MLVYMLRTSYLEIQSIKHIMQQWPPYSVPGDGYSYYGKMEFYWNIMYIIMAFGMRGF